MDHSRCRRHRLTPTSPHRAAKSARPVIVRKPQTVDNIPPECESGEPGNRGCLDDQIAEPQAEPGPRRKSRGEALGALLLAADEVAQDFLVIGEGFVVAIALGSGIALTPVAPDGLSMVAVVAGSAVIAGAAALASWRHGQRVDAFNKELSA